MGNLQNQDIIANQTDRSGELNSVSELSPEGLAEIEQAKILNNELENLEGSRLEVQRRYAQERKLIAEEEAQFKRDLIYAEADVLQQFGGLLQQLGEENKGLAIAGIVAEQIASTAKVIISTVEANAKAVAASPLTLGQPWVSLNTISAGIGIVSGVAAATKAISQLGGGGGVSGGSVPQAGGQAAPSFNVVGTSGTNQAYAKVHGNRGKQMNPNQKK